MGQLNPHQGYHGWYCWAGTRHLLFWFLSQLLVLAGGGKAGKQQEGFTEATVGSVLEMPGKQNRPCLHLHQALSSHSWGSPFPEGVKERFGILPLLSALN